MDDDDDDDDEVGCALNQLCRLLQECSVVMPCSTQSTSVLLFVSSCLSYVTGVSPSDDVSFYGLSPKYCRPIAP